MDEIKKTLETLKARWPETALIILMFLLGGQNKLGLDHRFPEWKMIFVSAGLLATVVNVILLCGFLRTCYLENDKRQSVGVLLSTGVKFFLRIVGFGLLLLAPMMAGFFVLSIFKLPPDRLLRYFFLWPLILIKIWLLVPAVIIVFDTPVFASFKRLKLYRLTDAKPLITLYLIHLGLPLVWRVFKLNTEIINSHLYISLFQFTVSGFLLLMISVTAVRFVAALKPVNVEIAA